LGRCSAAPCGQLGAAAGTCMRSSPGARLRVPCPVGVRCMRGVKVQRYCYVLPTPGRAPPAQLPRQGGAQYRTQLSPPGPPHTASAASAHPLHAPAEANKIEAAKFGAIHCLARMLEAAEAPAAQEAAAAALANLAANSSEAQSLIASAGGCWKRRKEAGRGGKGGRGKAEQGEVCGGATAGGVLCLHRLSSQPLHSAWLGMAWHAPTHAALPSSHQLPLHSWHPHPTPPHAGAIPLLAEVLRCGTPAAKQHAARAIRNLGAAWGCLNAL
jgi:hypothetical protein